MYGVSVINSSKNVARHKKKCLIIAELKIELLERFGENGRKCLEKR